MKEEIINLSNWEEFNEFQKYQFETDGYVYILEYLLKQNVDINNIHYQYYEKKYIEAYFNLILYKDKLTHYLEILDKNIKRWDMINFTSKEVKIYYE